MSLRRVVTLVIQLVTTLLPWPIRRRILQRCLGYKIDPTARIALAWIYPRRLVMGPRSRIGPFTVAIHLDSIRLDESATIGRGNWITGFPTGTPSKHFAHQPDRVSELIVGRHSAITKNHHLDCTSTISIGEFVTIAGYRSQLLTHSVDVVESRQDSAPIRIGDYCFVGTSVVVLGGGELPSHSILGACSLLNKAHEGTHRIYGGIPARELSAIPADAKYFHRERGFIN